MMAPVVILGRSWTLRTVERHRRCSPRSRSVPAAGVATPATADGLAVGIGEQGSKMFDEKLFRDLDLEHARLIVPYDAASQPVERQLADVWLAAAKRAGVEPFVTFGHSRATRRSCRASREFRSAFKRVCAPLPGRPRLCAVERDQPQQPADVARAEAGRAVLQRRQGRVSRLHGARRRPARPGRHDALPRAATSATSTASRRSGGCTTTPTRTASARAACATCSPPSRATSGSRRPAASSSSAAASRATRSAPAARSAQAFKLARQNPRVKRIYLYNWTAARPADRFDSGLVGTDGTPRPGYDALRAALERLAHAPAPASRRATSSSRRSSSRPWPTASSSAAHSSTSVRPSLQSSSVSRRPASPESRRLMICSRRAVARLVGERLSGPGSAHRRP